MTDAFIFGMAIGFMLGIVAAAIWVSVCVVWIDGKGSSRSLLRPCGKEPKP